MRSRHLSDVGLRIEGWLWAFLWSIMDVTGKLLGICFAVFFLIRIVTWAWSSRYSTQLCTVICLLLLEVRDSVYILINLDSRLLLIDISLRLSILTASSWPDSLHIICCCLGRLNGWRGHYFLRLNCWCSCKVNFLSLWLRLSFLVSWDVHSLRCSWSRSFILVSWSSCLRFRWDLSLCLLINSIRWCLTRWRLLGQTLCIRSCETERTHSVGSLARGWTICRNAIRGLAIQSLNTLPISWICSDLWGSRCLRIWSITSKVRWLSFTWCGMLRIEVWGLFFSGGGGRLILNYLHLRTELVLSVVRMIIAGWWRSISFLLDFLNSGLLGRLTRETLWCVLDRFGYVEKLCIPPEFIEDFIERCLRYLW